MRRGRLCVSAAGRREGAAPAPPVPRQTTAHRISDPTPSDVCLPEPGCGDPPLPPSCHGAATAGKAFEPGPGLGARLGADPALRLDCGFDAGLEHDGVTTGPAFELDNRLELDNGLELDPAFDVDPAPELDNGLELDPGLELCAEAGLEPDGFAADPAFEAGSVYSFVPRTADCAPPAPEPERFAPAPPPAVAPPADGFVSAFAPQRPVQQLPPQPAPPVHPAPAPAAAPPAPAAVPPAPAAATADEFVSVFMPQRRPGQQPPPAQKPPPKRQRGGGKPKQPRQPRGQQRAGGTFKMLPLTAAGELLSHRWSSIRGKKVLHYGGKQFRGNAAHARWQAIKEFKSDGRAAEQQAAPPAAAAAAAAAAAPAPARKRKNNYKDRLEQSIPWEEAVAECKRKRARVEKGPAVGRKPAKKEIPVFGAGVPPPARASVVVPASAHFCGEVDPGGEITWEGV